MRLWGGYIDQMLQMITHQSDLVTQDEVQLRFNQKSLSNQRNFVID